MGVFIFTADQKLGRNRKGPDILGSLYTSSGSAISCHGHANMCSPYTRGSRAVILIAVIILEIVCDSGKFKLFKSFYMQQYTHKGQRCVLGRCEYADVHCVISACIDAVTKTSPTEKTCPT